jgi:hypothetical protein
MDAGVQTLPDSRTSLLGRAGCKQAGLFAAGVRLQMGLRLWLSVDAGGEFGEHFRAHTGRAPVNAQRLNLQARLSVLANEGAVGALGRPSPLRSSHEGRPA